MKRVLLINPPYYVNKGKMDFYPSFPLGMGYIAAYLEQKGYAVRVIDAFAEGYKNRIDHDDKYYRIGLSNQGILFEISKFSPDIIGISNMFSIQHFALHTMAKAIKEHNRDLPIVVGGPHVSAVPELVLSDNNIDYGIIGEGEKIFVELLEALSGAGRCQDIRGIVYREGGQIKINLGQRFIEDLNDMPFPAWHLFKMDAYLNQEMSHGGEVRKRPFMTLLTSRGCLFNCFFCSVRDTWGRRLRTRSAENVTKEIVALREKFNIKEIVIVDDNFNFDVDRLNKLLDFIIKENMDLSLQIPNGLFIPKLTKEILHKLKRAGVYRIFLPIESGNEFVRNNIIRKPLDIKHVKEIVDYCKEIDIEITGYFILGLPGETKEQMKDTFRLAHELKIGAYYSIATPFPGSDLYAYVKEKGLLKFYDIDKCSDEYNINSSDWSAKELKKLVGRELFKIKLMRRINSCIKNPFKIPVKLYKIISGNTRRIVYKIRHH